MIIRITNVLPAGRQGGGKGGTPENVVAISQPLTLHPFDAGAESMLGSHRPGYVSQGQHGWRLHS